MLIKDSKCLHYFAVLLIYDLTVIWFSQKTEQLGIKLTVGKTKMNRKIMELDLGNSQKKMGP